jgi:hypothetical protein
VETKFQGVEGLNIVRYDIDVEPLKVHKETIVDAPMT